MERPGCLWRHSSGRVLQVLLAVILSSFPSILAGGKIVSVVLTSFLPSYHQRALVLQEEEEEGCYLQSPLTLLKDA